MRPKNWIEMGQDDIVQFDVHCVMKKCWANEFLSMLADMQRLGEMGCSRMRGMYCDGDGDFRPKFSHNLEGFTEAEHRVSEEDSDMWYWDAG